MLKTIIKFLCIFACISFILPSAFAIKCTDLSNTGWSGQVTDSRNVTTHISVLLDPVSKTNQQGIYRLSGAMYWLNNAHEGAPIDTRISTCQENIWGKTKFIRLGASQNSEIFLDLESHDPSVKKMTISGRAIDKYDINDGYLTK